MKALFKMDCGPSMDLMKNVFFLSSSKVILVPRNPGRIFISDQWSAIEIERESATQMGTLPPVLFHYRVVITENEKQSVSIVCPLDPAFMMEKLVTASRENKGFAVLRWDRQKVTLVSPSSIHRIDWSMVDDDSRTT